MSIHQFPGPVFSRLAPDPEITKGVLANGKDASAAADVARYEFEAKHPGFWYGEIVDHEDDRFKRLVRERRWAQWRRFWEAPRSTIVTAEIVKKIPTLSVVKAVVLLVLAGAGMVMGNFIGAKYVVGSGSDLYATDPNGAHLFMGVVLLGTGALKALECFIDSTFGKKLYALLICALSIPGLIIWVLSFALVFVPDLSGGIARMVGTDRRPQEMISLLIALHLLADVFLGAACFGAAEKILLGGNKQESIDNPKYVYWNSRVEKLDEEIYLARKVRADALDYLNARQSALKGSELAAGLEVDRQQAVMTAAAQATAHQAHSDALK